MHPLVSVVIPVFNCQAYIAEAVESALSQDYPCIEVIVVNDGSTDGTLSELRRFGDRIRVIDQVNSGPPRARNAGMAAANGEYIAFLDADDIWLQGKLWAQVSHLESNPDVGTCYFQWHVWPADADGVYRRPVFASDSVRDAKPNPTKSGWVYQRLLFDCELLTTTVMVRASVARQVGEFDRGLWNGDDYDYWLRLSQAAPITRLEPAGALYRELPGSVSRRARPLNDELIVIERAVARFGFSDPSGTVVDRLRVLQRMDNLVFQFGYMHLKQGDPAIALKSFMRNLRRRPWRLKTWAHAARARWRMSRGRQTVARL